MMEVDKMSEWISVEERLPENEKPVLVYVGYSDTDVGFISVLTYFAYDPTPHWQHESALFSGQKVLYWMPLPELPEATS